MESHSMLETGKMIVISGIILAVLAFVSPQVFPRWLQRVSEEKSVTLSSNLGISLAADGNDEMSRKILEAEKADKIRMSRLADNVERYWTYALFPVFVVLLVFRWAFVLLRRPAHFLIMLLFFFLSGLVFKITHGAFGLLRSVSDDTIRKLAEWFGKSLPDASWLKVFHEFFFLPAVLFLFMYVIERISAHYKSLKGTETDDIELQMVKDKFSERSKDCNWLELHPAPRRIIFRILEDSSLNAFAYGTRTIMFNSGLLTYFNIDTQGGMETILGVVAHEHGHLFRKDGIALEIWDTCFNLPAYLCWILYLLCELAAILISAVPFVGAFLGPLLCDISSALWPLMLEITGFTREMFRIFTGKSEEIKADKHATRLGFGGGLICFLNVLGDDCSGPMDEHPMSSERIRLINAEMRKMCEEE